MRDLLGDLPGERLDWDGYGADVDKRLYAVDGVDSWKLERQQHFREPGDASWEAFARGDWDEALRLIEARRDDLTAEAAEAAEHRCRLLRVRVVELPLVPYLHWELYLLRLRAETGEDIRIVGPEAVREHEGDGPLPELLTAGPEAVYRILYDEDGIGYGAVRYLGADVTARVTALASALFDAGEDIRDFFAREVAPLPPPHPA